MPAQQSNCTIVEMAQLNAYAYSMTLMAPEIAGAIAPGQFLHIKCGEALLLRRPISICTWDETCIRIVFEVRGEGTQYLASCKAGDTLDVLGPLGHGFTLSPSDRPLLVGGGLGTPPMLGCAQYTGGNAEVILGFRSKERAMLVEAFTRHAASVTLASDDGSLGFHGFVDALVRDRLSRAHNFTAVLTCGPKPMLRAVAQVAAQFSIPCQVSLEERMGCGVGACLVCACKTSGGTYKHVCKDGPVFDATEVDWDAE
ncbi:MAG: dihydroorotate dehydrogenase electron transfer subunit [Oscillospiraceae bacterium]|nr:dihydroorotate dehydrogenase electron transfer subunit [Oscillospiraceae bacterium]